MLEGYVARYDIGSYYNNRFAARCKAVVNIPTDDCMVWISPLAVRFESDCMFTQRYRMYFVYVVENGSFKGT